MKTILALSAILIASACNTKNNSMSAAPDTAHDYDQKTIAAGGPQQTTGTSPTPSATP